MSTARDAEYKQRQATSRDRERSAVVLQPTLPARINRLNPAEKHELQQIIRSLKLRKIIRRTLAEAYWLGEQQKHLDLRTSDSMQRLQAAARTQESLQNYERALTSSDTPAFELQITKSV